VDEKMNNNSFLVEKTHSIGGASLRLLLLTLQLEIELLLALHCRTKVSRFRGYETDCNSKTRRSDTDRPSDGSHTCRWRVSR
jgi:hypothetical protein